MSWIELYQLYDAVEETLRRFADEGRVADSSPTYKGHAPQPAEEPGAYAIWVVMEAISALRAGNDALAWNCWQEAERTLGPSARPFGTVGLRFALAVAQRVGNQERTEKYRAEIAEEDKQYDRLAFLLADSLGEAEELLEEETERLAQNLAGSLIDAARASIGTGLPQEKVIEWLESKFARSAAAAKQWLESVSFSPVPREQLVPAAGRVQPQNAQSKVLTWESANREIVLRIVPADSGHVIQITARGAPQGTILRALLTNPADKQATHFFLALHPSSSGHSEGRVRWEGLTVVSGSLLELAFVLPHGLTAGDSYWLGKSVVGSDDSTKEAWRSWIGSAGNVLQQEALRVIEESLR